MFIAGTRPEAVKLAPLLLDLQARGHRPLLVATGQHRDLFDQALVGFGLAADHDLGVMATSPDATVGRLVPALADVVRARRPEWVVVQGDTSSTLAGALAARYAGVRLAHVEAGLRTGTHDPHPEEMHRKLVAQMAQLHFAPTPAAAAALQAEGISNGVHVTGNSGIDALLLMQARLAGDTALARAAMAPLAGSHAGGRGSWRPFTAARIRARCWMGCWRRWCNWPVRRRSSCRYTPARPFQAQRGPNSTGGRMCICGRHYRMPRSWR